MSTVQNYKLVKATAVYNSNGIKKQKSINTFFTTEEPFITEKAYNTLLGGVLHKITSDLNIDTKQVLDLTIDNVIDIGSMTHEQFYGVANNANESV